MRKTFAIGIGGAAGQGVATPGDIFAKIFSRRGLHLNAYNAYQSIIRGGHTFLTIRTGPDRVTNLGDRIDLLIPLNQDAMNRHLGLLLEGAACIYNADTITPGAAACGKLIRELQLRTRSGEWRSGDSDGHTGHRRAASVQRRNSVRLGGQYTGAYPASARRHAEEDGPI